MASLIHPGYAQQLVSKGFGGYAGWGDDEAYANFQATQGAGKGGGTSGRDTSGIYGSNYDTVGNYLGPTSSSSTTTPTNPVENILAQALQKQQAAYEKYSKDVKTYDANNPFNFDEYLRGEATKQAQEQQGLGSTYYHNTLSDYLLGVSRKIQNSATNTRDLLGELSAQSESFGKDTQLKLTKAVNDAQQGFADAGLFDSGARYKQEGLFDTAAQSDISNEQRRTAYNVNEANKRNADVTANYGLGNYTIGGNPMQASGLLARQDLRNITQESNTAVGTLAAQLTGEKEQARNRDRAQLLPPELQANQGFNMLKQLGYSG